MQTVRCERMTEDSFDVDIEIAMLPTEFAFERSHAMPLPNARSESLSHTKIWIRCAQCRRATRLLFGQSESDQSIKSALTVEGCQYERSQSFPIRVKMQGCEECEQNGGAHHIAVQHVSRQQSQQQSGQCHSSFLNAL